MIDFYAMTVMTFCFSTWRTPLSLICLQSRGTNHRDKMPKPSCNCSCMPFRHPISFTIPSNFPSLPTKESKVLLCLAQGVSLVAWTASIFSCTPISATFLILAMIVHYCAPFKNLGCCNTLGQTIIRLPSFLRKTPSRYLLARNCYLMNILPASLYSELGQR